MATSEADLRDIQARLYRAQTRWEPWKALAAIIAASAVFCGSVLALSSYLAHAPQNITATVRLEGPLTR